MRYFTPRPGAIALIILLASAWLAQAHPGHAAPVIEIMRPAAGTNYFGGSAVSGPALVSGFDSLIVGPLTAEVKWECKHKEDTAFIDVTEWSLLSGRGYTSDSWPGLGASGTIAGAPPGFQPWPLGPPGDPARSPPGPYKIEARVFCYHPDGHGGWTQEGFDTHERRVFWFPGL